MNPRRLSPPFQGNIYILYIFLFIFLICKALSHAWVGIETWREKILKNPEEKQLNYAWVDYSWEA